MSENDYKVHSVFLKKADFEVLILALPEEELEDKLAYLAREKGQITKSLFEDFVITICVANINQLLYSINQMVTLQEKLLSIREELLNHLYNINPKLKPENLIINKNFVIKFKKGKKLKKDEKFIMDNKHWDTPYYDDIANAYDNYLNEQQEELPPPPPVEETSGKTNGKLKDVSSINKGISDLKYKVTKKWWKRMGQYVNIKKYSPDDVAIILKQRYFHNKASFTTFIVSVCVQDFEELFALLDIKGIPSRVSPPTLMSELYELCRECNELLTFESAQNLSTKTSKEGKRVAPVRGASTSTPSMLDQMKDKRKSFKEVPKKDLMDLGQKIKKHLIGQDEAIDTITDAIQRASVGLKDPVKPIGSFLFAGQTGVGKSLSAKILSSELTKSNDTLVTVDCSEYSAEHEYAKLIGSPNGYVGFEQGGMLTNAISNNPFSIVVFDEIEKASTKVHELLLQILEEGRLTDGKGNTVSFSETIVIMTSNVGVNEIDAITKSIGFGDISKITDRKKDMALTEALKKKFKPEFLNRIDSIVNFRKLVKKDYMKIVTIELNKLNENLHNSNTEYNNTMLYFDKKLKNLIYKNGVNEEYGARPIKRYIEQNVSTPLAKKLIFAKTINNTAVKISSLKDKVDIIITNKKQKKQKTMTKKTK